VLAGLMAVMQLQILSPACVAVQDSASQNETAQSLLLLLEGANTTLINTFQRLAAKHIQVPQASKTQYHLALSLAKESRSLFQEADYSEASRKAVEAMQKFKEALQITYSIVYEPQTEAENMADMTLYLDNALKRSGEFVDWLKKLTYLATAKGYNTTSIEAEIESLILLLDEASDNLRRENLDMSSTKLEETETLVTRLSRYITELTNNVQIQRLETYVVEAQVRLTTLRQSMITSPVATTSPTIKASLQALNVSQTSLDAAKDYLNRAMIDATVDQLVVAKQSEQKAVELYEAAIAVAEPSSESPNSQ
jgi:hypothetical protein